MDEPRKAVRDELWALRREPGPLTATKLATKNHIIFYVAGGDPYQALYYLRGLGFDHEADREIIIALRSIGLHPDDDHKNVSRRLASIGEVFGGVEGHMRRLSDSGIEKLVSIIVDGLIAAGPTIELWLFQRSYGGFLTRVVTYVPQNAYFESLNVQLNGGELEPVELHEVPEQNSPTFRVFSSETWPLYVALPEIHRELISVYAITSSPPQFSVSSNVSTSWNVHSRFSRYHAYVKVTRVK